jgi:hypothetical protein
VWHKRAVGWAFPDARPGGHRETPNRNGTTNSDGRPEGRPCVCRSKSSPGSRKGLACDGATPAYAGRKATWAHLVLGQTARTHPAGAST